MPTGYTADVQSGKVTDFATFAMQCARAFGACITMRDDPADTPIPDAFEPCAYHATALEKAEAELQRLEAMDDVSKGRSARAAHEDELARWREREDERLAQRQRYEAMLALVNEWGPPTSEHADFKHFMKEQLTGSIEFDCSAYGDEPTKKSGADWHAEALKSAAHDIEYHTRNHAEEVQRARKRTGWVQALRNSLLPKAA